MELVLKPFIYKEIHIKQYNLVVVFIYQVDSYHTIFFTQLCMFISK